MSLSEQMLLSLQISETNRGRAYWCDKAQLGEDDLRLAREAQLILAPLENFRNDRDLFPKGTDHFYEYMGSRLKVAIAITPDRYEEVVLHGREIRMPALVVARYLAEFVIAVAAGYVVNELNANPVQDTVEIELIIEDEEKPCLSLKYKGPVGQMAERLIEEAKRCGRGSDDPKPSNPQSLPSHERPPAQELKHEGDTAIG